MNIDNDYENYFYWKPSRRGWHNPINPASYLWQIRAVLPGSGLTRLK